MRDARPNDYASYGNAARWQTCNFYHILSTGTF